MTPSSPGRASRYFLVTLRWCATTAAAFAVAYWLGNYAIDRLFTKTYTATAKILLPATTTGSGMRSVVDEQFDKILSFDTLMPVIYHLELEKTWAKLGPNPDQEVLTDDMALAYMKSILRLDWTPNSTAITISAYSHDPNEAANIANEVTDRYVAESTGSNANQILARATVPILPAHPNPTIQFAVTVGAAVVVALIAGCFVEVVLLLVRASENDPS